MDAVCYTRRLINQYIRRKNKHEDYLKDCMDIIDYFPNYRKQINWKIQQHFQDPQLPSGLQLKQIACNFDPTLYLQPFLSIISSLSMNLKENKENTMVGLVFGLSQSMASTMFGTITY